MGYSPLGHKELDRTERLTLSLFPIKEKILPLSLVISELWSPSSHHQEPKLTVSSCFSCHQRPLSISPLVCLGYLGFPDGSSGKESMWVQSLGQEDLLEKEMATHSSIVAWKISWTEEPGRL